MESLSAIFFPAAFLGMWGLVLYGIAQLGGWRAWADVYQSDPIPDVTRKHMCSLRLGRNGTFSARYNGVITVGVNADGLYLRPFLLFSFGHAGLFLPFSDCKGIAKGGHFDISSARLPDHTLRVSSSLGRWIEDTAMSKRRSEA